MIKQITTETEIRDVIELFMAVFLEAPYNECWTKETVRKRFLEFYEKGKDFCLYAEDHGKTTGFIFCQTQTWHDGTHLIVEEIGVDKRYRKRGIATAIVKKLEDIAKSNGITKIDLFSNERSSGVKFWKKQGYKENGYIELDKRL